MTKAEKQILDNIELKFDTSNHIINIRISEKVRMEVHTLDEYVYFVANATTAKYKCTTIAELEEHIYTACEAAAVLEQFKAE